jgi:MFS superfamily sulfate permease-like transporter
MPWTGSLGRLPGIATVATAPSPVEWVIVAAEPITGLDTTAVDELVDLDRYLESNGIRLAFAEMKGPIKDRLIRFGVGDRFDSSHFYPTVESAVAAFHRRADHIDDPTED